MISRHFLDGVMRAVIRADQQDWDSQFRKIEAVAYSLYDQYTLSTKAQASFTLTELMFLVSDMGYIVEFRTGLPWPVKAFTNGRTIVVSASLSAQRLRFALAHELGHVMIEQIGSNGLIPPMGALPDAPRTPEDWRNRFATETCANYFAGCLLAPSALAGPLLRNLGYFPEVIQQYFDVSYETAAHRTVVLCPEDLHFAKVDSKGVLRKAYSRHGFQLPFPAMRVCEYWGARSSLDGGCESEIVQQVSEVVDLTGDSLDATLFCRIRVVSAEPDHTQTHTITIGCHLDKIESVFPVGRFRNATLPAAVRVFSNCRAFCPIHTRGECKKNVAQQFEEFDAELLNRVRSRVTTPE